MTVCEKPIKTSVLEWGLRIACLLLCILAGGIPAQAQRASAPAQQSCPTCPQMYVSPATLTVNAGESFSITVMISSSRMMRGAQAGLMFDPTFLEATGWEEGTLFKDWALANGGSTMIPSPPVIDNERGIISLAPVLIVGGRNEDAGPTGSGSLFIYHLRAKPGVSGQSALMLRSALGDMSISDPNGEIFPDLVVTHGQVQIVGGVPPMPTDTPTATPGGALPTPTGTPTATPAGTPQTPTGTPTVTPAGTPQTPTGTPTVTPAGTPRTPTGTPTVTPTGTPPTPVGTLTVTPTGTPPTPADTLTVEPTGTSPTPADTLTVAPTGTSPTPAVAPASQPPTPASEPTEPACPTCPHMYVWPAKITVNPGESFSVTVMISSSRMMRGAQAGLMFDPTLLEATGWEEGTLFKDWALADGGSTMIPSPPVIDNEHGTISLAPVLIVGGAHEDSGPTGTGSLLIYYLKARPDVNGWSALTLTGDFGPNPGQVSISDPNGELFPDLVVTHGEVQIGQGGIYRPMPPTAVPPTPDIIANMLKPYASVGTGQWKVPWNLFLIVGGTVGIIGGVSLTLTSLKRRPWPPRLLVIGRLSFHGTRAFFARLLSQWPRWLSMALALVPLAMLLLVVIGLVVQSQLALRALGLGQLLGDRFVSTHSGSIAGGRYYGLLPGLWGTVLVSAIALVGAVPVSLALAILVTDFSLGPLSQAIKAIIGALAGIPPVFYALVATLLLRTYFIEPKFTGAEILRIRPAEWPPPDMWSEPSAISASGETTLLGGIVLCLLIVPFMVPLIVDAIKNVPHDLREASWGLGASRWYTLTRVVLRSALPGISSAVVLGLLKAMGEVMIPAFAIGYVPFPASMTDIMADSLKGLLTRTPPLTSTGAGLVLAPLGNARQIEIARSTGSFAGLLLLLLAVPLIALVTWLQKHLQGRLSR